MKKLLILLLLISCGKIKVDEVEIADSSHTVEHKIILDGDLSLFDDRCATQYPDSEEDQQACVDGYFQALEALLNIENGKKKTNTLQL